MDELRIVSVVGARPNFMKIAPFFKEIERHNASIKTSPDSAGRSNRTISHTIVHTGQHYDEKMSNSFFEDLGIPEPAINLGIGSGSHAEQVGRTMIEFEKVIRVLKPDWVVVVGDVNATCACSITAKKEQVLLAHIEAGLRSYDMSMPEEINRLVTDRLADLLLTPDEISSQNLRNEGVPEEKIRFVGNIMIDTLEGNRDRAMALSLETILRRNVIPGQNGNLPTKNPSGGYGLITLHRPSNVDDSKTLTQIVRFILDEACGTLPLVWAIHPRTRKQLEKVGLFGELLKHSQITIVEPLGYLEMLRLNSQARIMMTDSGGLQEECCVLGTPCLTLRWNTERPITLQEHGGASVLVGNEIDRIRETFFSTLSQDRRPKRPELWDGRTAQRIVASILEC